MNAPSGDNQSLIMTLALIGGVILVLMGLMWWARRRHAKPTKTPDLDTGFTLVDVAKLHDAGQIDAQEFEALKAKVVASLEHLGQGPSDARP